MNEHRSERLEERDRLTPDELHVLSENAGNNLFRIEDFAPPATVMFYASFRSEVDTYTSMNLALEMGVRVVLPVTKSREKKLIPKLVRDLENDLKPGYCSIMEPVKSRTAEVDISTIDVVIVPGSAFDLEGGRLGYGGGFYDRFLAGPECRALRVGLCFELQLVEKLKLEPHDQMLDMLVTEKGIYRFDRKLL